MTALTRKIPAPPKAGELELSDAANARQFAGQLFGRGLLLSIASVSAIAVLFIFYYIARDAIPFFRIRGFIEFFTGTEWYPSADPAHFGVFPIFAGSAIVTVGSTLIAVPLGVTAAVCLSDVLPFNVRQAVKPVIEILAAIPSVAYGFFALVVFAPMLQNNGGAMLVWMTWIAGLPVGALVTTVASDLITNGVADANRKMVRAAAFVVIGGAILFLLKLISDNFNGMEISSGANAFNVSVILGIMALPTVVSVSEDALQAVSRELREGSYALGSTRAETLIKVVIPAASSGICAAAILGIMRALGETMVVWMASGNSAQIPEPFYNFMQPVRTLTATIAGDMGEADHVTGSARYHVLFAMALCLLTFSFILNLVSEWAVKRSAKKMGKA